jgi:DNA-binding NtrC family response regulator
MTGRELASSIQEQWPGLPVLFMSGYVGGETAEGEGTLEGAPLIKKPFTPRALEGVVRERLDWARGLQTP